MTSRATTDNASDLVSWDEMTIPRTLARATTLWADSSALEDEDGVTKFTFAELAEASERAARGFIAAGIERGDRVAIWAPNSWRWVVAALGLQSAGRRSRMSAFGSKAAVRRHLARVPA